MKVVADDKIPFLRGVLEPFAEVIYLPGNAITREDLNDADALLIRTRTKCGKELLAGTKVKFIATATIGCDHIDSEACAELGIHWCSAPGCNAASVAQYMTSLLIRDARKTGIPLCGKTLGIIGAGHVGSKVAAAASALGMRVLLNDPPRERKEGSGAFVSLDRLLAESDVVTLHTPLDSSDSPDRTLHLADSSFFQRMEREPLFVNASRGAVTDTQALKAALKTGKVCAAALDVWEGEPDLEPELLDMIAYATPHIAGYSADGKANGTSMSVRNLARFFGISELQDFFPQGIPEPAQKILTLGGADPVGDAVLSSYDILQDDARLRADPGCFEKQRGNYPLRREFCAYTVSQASHLTDEQKKTLQLLNFLMKTT